MSDFVHISNQIISSLKRAGINFLAVDFDNTLISKHTAGSWTGSAEQLGLFVRPLFRFLIPKCIQEGIFVAIVTFSGQVPIIECLLRNEFPLVASYIPVRGNDCSWSYVGRGCTKFKQPHLASAAEYLYESQHAVISRASTLLLDDEFDNIRCALDNNVRAVTFQPTCEEGTIADLINLSVLQ